MVQVNIIEQFATFFKVFKENPYGLILMLAAIVSLFILLLANKFKSKMITKILCILVYLGIFSTLFYFYHNEILSLLDYLMNIVFLFLFFPNLAVYILVLIIINIIIIQSTFSKKVSKGIKNINIFFFIFFHILFYFIIDNILKNNINVYEPLNVYTNSDLLILIELSMQLFLVWLFVLLLGRVTSLLITHITKKHMNHRLVLEETGNKNELSHLEVMPEVMEIEPKALVLEDDFSAVDENIQPQKNIDVYNIYNDYLDVEPVKKKKSLPILEVNTTEEKPRKEETKEQITSYNGLSFESFNIIENSLSDTHYLNIETEIDNNMDIVFDTKNHYLKNIMFDIQKLKDNSNDKNQIKKIYEEIKRNQKELTLNDYNYLIDVLLDIKK